jgi:hypothetical protein
MNPVTRAGPTGNSYTHAGAENCEFYQGPDGYFHATCTAHGESYPNGGCPHYLVSVLAGATTTTGEDTTHSTTSTALSAGPTGTCDV